MSRFGMAKVEYSEGAEWLQAEHVVLINGRPPLYISRPRALRLSSNPPCGHGPACLASPHRDKDFVLANQLRAPPIVECVLKRALIAFYHLTA